MTKYFRYLACAIFASCMAVGAMAQTLGKAKVETINVNGVSFDMVYVEGGSFNMGDNGDKNAKPAHNEVVNHFFIAQVPVTQALWKTVMGLNPSDFKGDDLPVENITWYECQDFIEQLNKVTGYEFRLPTEAEWEYAARGGYNSQNYTHSGANATDLYRIAWFADDSDKKTHPVANKRPNELGIYDMSGNVWEWTSDLWSDNYNSPRKGGDSGQDRVCRGGAWNGSTKHCANSFRTGNHASRRANSIGLRLAASAK